MERTEFEKVRASVKEQCGNRVEIRLDRGRNKVDIQTGVIKEAYPGANIVAIDYDPGATKVNQENRIKLMLASAAAEK